jgi:small subunit ribosomal protein S1
MPTSNPRLINQFPNGAASSDRRRRHRRGRARRRRDVGETRLSREKAKRAHVDPPGDAFNKGEAVQAIINGRVKGGFTVEIENVRAFLPGSLVDIRPVRDTGYLEGKQLEFKVIKLDQKRNNVVVSRRAVVEEEHSAERDALLDRLQEGATLKGVVKNLTDYGAFVDLGGIDGLLHITDMAWRRVKQPSEVVAVGQELERGAQVRSRAPARFAGLKQLGAVRGGHRASLSAGLAPVRQGHEHHRLRLLRGDRAGVAVSYVSEMDWTNKNVNQRRS